MKRHESAMSIVMERGMKRCVRRNHRARWQGNLLEEITEKLLPYGEERVIVANQEPPAHHHR
jgi:hypothetical protein